MSELLELSTHDEWENLLNDSTNQPVLLLKHSTTCPISAAAWKAFNDTLEDLNDKGVKTAFVKVIESRPVSNIIAETLNVTHQSPQLIFINNKASDWSTYHYDITKKNILEKLS